MHAWSASSGERIRPAVHPVTSPLNVEIWSTAGEPVPMAEGLTAPYRPITPGTAWGTPWGTSWFRGTGTVPADWAGRAVEAVLDLGFTPRTPGFQCEDLVHLPDGTPVKGLHPRNSYVRVGSPVAGGEQFDWLIEAASNPDLDGSGVPFQPTPMGYRATAGDAPQYVLGEMNLAVFDERVWNLVMDLEVLGELMAELPVEGARRWEILRAVGRALDAVDLQDVNGTVQAARVHREARETYVRLAAELESIIGGAQRALAGDASGGTDLAFNSAPHSRGSVPAGGASPRSAHHESAVPVPLDGGGYALENGLLRVEIDGRGLVVSAYDHGAEREAIAPGQAANLLQLHPDFPNQWDAWDVDAFYRNVGSDLTDVTELGVEGAAVRVERSFGDSRVVQVLTVPARAKRLDIATEVDWHETERFLKLAFPLDVKADRYASETQSGHVYRPTHQK